MVPKIGAAIVLYVTLYLQYVHFRARLPERVASHFGMNGVADGYMSRDAFFGTFAFFLTAMTALFLVLPVLLRRVPSSLWNLPNKDYWLAPEHREATMRYVENFVSVMGLCVGLLLNAILFVSLQANLSPRPVIDRRVFWVCQTIFLVVVLTSVVMLLVRFGRRPRPETIP